MKFAFAIIFSLLCVLSAYVYTKMPANLNLVPVVFWGTDANPARLEQINLFHRWQIKHNRSVEIKLSNQSDVASFRRRISHTLIDDIVISQPQTAPLLAGLLRERREIIDGKEVVTPVGISPEFIAANPGIDQALLSEYDASRVKLPMTIYLPRAEMMVDSNADLAKRLVQGVSGVAADNWDLYSGGQTLRAVNEVGLAMDVTDRAKAGGYEYTKTYSPLALELCIRNEKGELRQFGFPCNVSTDMMFVNVGTLKALNQPVPSSIPTIEEFERLGKAFVAAANAGRTERNRAFYATDVFYTPMARSYGGSYLDETLSGPALNRRGNLEAVKKKYQWTYVDRIVPSAADRSAASADGAGFAGYDAQLLNDGRAAMMQSGRWRLITFRQMNIDRVKIGQSPLEFTVVHPPYQKMPNLYLGTRENSVYTGSKHPELATLFQEYLASEEYNTQVVRDADALPPIPAYTLTEEYRNPPLDPARGVYPQTEHSLHAPFADEVEKYAIGGEYSRFLAFSVVEDETNRALERIMNNLATPEQAFRLADDRLKIEIDRNLREIPALKASYDAARRQQKAIDEQRRQIEAFVLSNPGKDVPAELRLDGNAIENQFLRRYYNYVGWLK